MDRESEGVNCSGVCLGYGNLAESCCFMSHVRRLFDIIYYMRPAYSPGASQGHTFSVPPMLGLSRMES